MEFFNQKDRLMLVHQRIKLKNTGSPTEFSELVGISKSQLFVVLNEMRQMGAEIKYSRRNRSYYYLKPVVDILEHVDPLTKRWLKLCF